MTLRNLTSYRTGDDRGQILLLTALSMTVLIGMAALSLDASFMYDKRNRLYAAADAAAKSGAIELKRNGSVTQGALEAFADQQVAAHGFTPTRSSGTTSVVVNHPPLFGLYATNIGFVEVIASEPTETFFGRILAMANMTPGARAVAGTAPGPNCIVTLGPPSNVPESLSIGASSTINLPTCSIADAGDLVMQSSGSINAASTGVVGDCIDTGGGCTHVTNMSTDAPTPTDPLAGLAQPTAPDPSSCQSVTAPGSGTPYSLTAGCYSFIDATATNVNITLGSGTYYFTGPFIIGNNALINGARVLLYFSGTAPSTATCTTGVTFGCISVGNGATMNLTAQNTGTYNGILMMAPSTNQTTVAFTGNNPTYNFSGALYFPNSHIDFDNGLSGTNDCTLIVARSLEINHGTGTFSNTCADYGGSPLMTTALAE